MTNPTPNESSAFAIPHSPDVERRVLSAAMQFPELLWKVADSITPVSFHLPRHRKIWESIRRLLDRDESIDIVSVAADLEQRGLLDECGGRTELADILIVCCTGAHLPGDANILLAQRKRRDLQATLHDALGGLHEDPVETVSRIESRMFEIAEIGHDPLRSTHDQIKQLIEGDYAVLKGQISGYSWPMPDLTRTTRGIQPGKVYLIIALYKTGKSKLAVAAMRRLVEDNVPMLFLSLEMGSRQVMHWLAGNALKVNTSLYGTCGLGQKQMEQSHQWITDNLGDGRLIVDDRAIQTPDTICSAMRQAALTRGVKVVFIDFLQKVVWSQKQPSVSDIGRGMNQIAAMAKRLGVAVIALSQVPKSAEYLNKGELITLGHVKDAGAYAEVADCSIAITDPERHKPSANSERFLKFLIEQRDGATRIMDVLADLRFGQFEYVPEYVGEVAHTGTAAA